MLASLMTDFTVEDMLCQDKDEHQQVPKIRRKYKSHYQINAMELNKLEKDT